ncbi:MAG: RNA polymerase factor sigma-54 [Deltaproteobacteria bacterium]|nr:RNA polymerase factor sigma-54 [Deltaproteobacteria bacterium]
MAADIRQDLRLSQQLVMTPQLQMAIKLLQLSRLELDEQLQKEMEQNPVLEDAAETETILEETPAVSLTPPNEKSDKKNDIDWQSYLEDYHNTDRMDRRHIRNDEDELPFGSTLAEKPTLTNHLLWQLHLSLFTPDEVRIGTFIIGNIDDDGYLQVTNLEEIANELGVSKDDVESVLKRVQEFDPVGIGARDVRECLLIQARLLPKRDKVVENIINNCFCLLGKRDYKGIAKALDIPIFKVVNAVRIISHMEPRPGRAVCADESCVIMPDIYIQKIGDDYVVSLNEDGMPRLKISPYYREMLANGGTASEGVKSYIKERLCSAVWLIKSIQQRQRTIHRVAESIVKFQREFLDKGIDYLKPLVLRDVAHDIGMHESTVSRVTTNKYAHTPHGILELKYFFSSGIKKEDGSDIASEGIKERIKKLIGGEDPKKPLSDQKIVRYLRTGGIDIARRTVAKYREAIKIPSSSERRQRF